MHIVGDTQRSSNFNKFNTTRTIEPSAFVASRLQEVMLWKELVVKEGPGCEMCRGVLCARRLSDEEAMWMCQTPGCLFPVGSDRFDAYVVKLSDNVSGKQGKPSQPNNKGSKPRQGKQTRGRLKPQGRRAPIEPEPCPLSSFDAAENEVPYGEGQLQFDSAALEALLGEETSADSPPMEPKCEGSSARPSQIVTDFTLAPPSCTTAQLLSDDDEDEEEMGQCLGEQTARPLTTSAPQHSFVPVSAADQRSNSPNRTLLSGASPSMVVSNTSSYDTMVSPSYAPNTPNDTATGQKRERCVALITSTNDDAELAAAWEAYDSDVDGDDARARAAGDATPERPFKVPRTDTMVS